MTIYRGISGVNRRITKQYRGISGVNREVKEQWRGVSGVNRRVFNNTYPVLVGTLGAQGSFTVLPDRIVIAIGSSSGEQLSGAARFNFSIASGSTVVVDWACTSRTGNSFYLQSQVFADANALFTRSTTSTWSRTTDTITCNVNASYLDILAARTAGGSNQTMTLEIYSVKVNGVQIFPAV